MKCIILGFDGLEYDIVNRLDLRSTKQREYGKVRLPKECFSEVSAPNFTHFEPWTPLVWYSFLTGELPISRFRRDMEVGGKWNNQILNVLEDLSVRVGLGSFRGIRILKILGFQKKLPIIRDYGVRTIFDLVNRAIDIDVPTYSENWPFGLAKNPEENFNEFINRSLKVEINLFNRNRKRVLDALRNDSEWNLLMMYTKLLDTCGELSFNRKLEQMYFLINDFAKDVRNLSNENFVLIISDHGMERISNTRFGKHSNHAFYSSNICLGLNNPKITEFYNVIQEVMKLPAYMCKHVYPNL